LNILRKLSPYRFLKLNPERGFFYNFFASFYRSVLDYITKGYGYHSASISYFILMSFFPLLFVLTVILSYIADIKMDIIVDVLNRLFPSITKTFVNFLVSLSKKRAVFGFLGVIVSFYFATGIFSSIHTALVHVFEGRDVGIQKTALVYILGIPIFTVALIFIYILGVVLSFVVEGFMHTTVWKLFFEYLSKVGLHDIVMFFVNITNMIQFTTYFIIIFLIYRFLTPLRVINLKNILWITALISVFLFFLKSAFNYYVSFASKANPIYGSLSGIFAFLAWLYISFGFILVGARILFYMESLDILREKIKHLRDIQ
jgi:membrane protein